MTFKDTASKIFQESIINGIYIDDNIICPFEKSEEYPSPIKIYGDFKEKNCSMDFYRYVGEPDENDLVFLLKNRDLVILDWQLIGSSNEYEPALKLLKSYIDKDMIPFIYIYTKTPEKDIIDNVSYPILGYFNNNKNDFSKKHFKNFLEENWGIDTDIFLKKLSKLTKELSLIKDDREKKKITFEEINKIVKEETEFGRFSKYIIDIFHDYDIGMQRLGYELNGLTSRPSDDINYNITLSKKDQRKTIYINNSIIIIRSKKEIKQEEIYNDFLNSMINERNILLTLFSLEMRNIFRERPAFIGSGLEYIDELSFIYHYMRFIEEDESLDSFYEFLKEVWADHASFIFLEKGSDLLDSLDIYIEENDIKVKLEEFIKKKERFISELVALNLYYNKQNNFRKKDDIIRFGDIFYCEEKEDNKYLLCITPHCDCLHPSKIQFQYFFVEGEEVRSFESCLERVEEDFVSFIENPIKDKIVCIDWHECKPFSLFINENQINNEITVNYKNNKLKMKYILSLKDNFTQRIANNAFSYPMRVGINMVKYQNGKKDRQMKSLENIINLKAIDNTEKAKIIANGYNFERLLSTDSTELLKHLSQEKTEALLKELKEYSCKEKVE